MQIMYQAPGKFKNKTVNFASWPFLTTPLILKSGWGAGQSLIAHPKGRSHGINVLNIH